MAPRWQRVANRFRETLLNKDTPPCIPKHKSREKTVKYDKGRYK